MNPETQLISDDKIKFGLKPVPEKAVGAWGARAILRNRMLEFLWDRQSIYILPEYKNFQKDFGNWINHTAIPRLKEHIRTHGWYGATTEFFTFSEENYHIKASPNASWGYCYIICWFE